MSRDFELYWLATLWNRYGGVDLSPVWGASFLSSMLIIAFCALLAPACSEFKTMLCVAQGSERLWTAVLGNRRHSGAHGRNSEQFVTGGMLQFSTASAERCRG